MSIKSLIFFYLISLSIISKVSTIETIKKYTKKTINDNEALLHIYNFNSGEKIYISITTSHENADTKLYYKFYTNIIGVNSFRYEKSIISVLNLIHMEIILIIIN